ncbi:MAG: hypothetical protein JJE39_04445 [Vicinamibacteria bacterium]|nr:hypothetical protein [Vicinamibacteria bacterium]
MVDLKRRSKILLSSTWLPKRALAWAGFAAIACFGLAFPLAYATSPAFKQSSTQEFPQPLRNVVWDVAWDPGPLSLGHQSLSRRCDVCHQVPFERVQDKACVKCHVVTGDHVSAVSAKAGVSLVTRCAECHRDHKGENAIVRTDAQLCVGCHGDIGALYPKTSLAAVSDFADAHPRFALTMVNASTGEVEAVPPDAVVSLHENSGLKFPHATHLAPAGIRSPQGLRVLECAQCHRPDEAGVRFQSVKMKDTCSECHRLEFEPALTTRQAPHGDPAAVLTSLREFYSSIALGERPIDVTLVNDLLRRPVASRSEVTQRNAFAWAEGKAQTVAADLIEKRVCMQCHDVRRASASSTPAGSEWVIAPVKITARWMPGAVFDHRTHRISTCQTCHDVKSSKTSADIAMPTLAVCRSCHVGAVAVRGKVRSPCEMCHSFHQHQKPLDQRAAAFMGATSQPQGAGEPR